MLTIVDFESFILSDLPYQQLILSVIDDLGRQIYLSNQADLFSYDKCTVKLEGMEKFNQQIYSYCEHIKIKYNHRAPVTCHAFRSFKQSKSFGLHADPDDIIILGCEGTKSLIVNQTSVELRAGEEIYIPANTPHLATNFEDSLILSFGLENFLVEKI